MLHAQTDWTGMSLFVTAVIGGVIALLKMWRDIKQNRQDIRQARDDSEGRDRRMDQRMNTKWEADIRRGQIGADRVLKEPRYDGPMTPDKDTAELVYKVDVRKAFEPIMPVLRRIRRDHPLMTRGQFAAKLEELHGEWMLKHLCEPLKIHQYECHAAAWELSEEGREVGWDSDKMRARRQA